MFKKNENKQEEAVVGPFLKKPQQECILVGFNDLRNFLYLTRKPPIVSEDTVYYFLLLRLRKNLNKMQFIEEFINFYIIFIIFANKTMIL